MGKIIVRKRGNKKIKTQKAGKTGRKRKKQRTVIIIKIMNICLTFGVIKKKSTR